LSDSVEKSDRERRRKEGAKKREKTKKKRFITLRWSHVEIY
jgi:hypothetical protein